MHLNFNLFFSTFKIYFPNASLPKVEFLEWFIGFVEGDGFFTITKRGDLQFVVSQSSDDVQILYYIKNNLYLGQVIIQSKANRVHRYILQDFKSIHLICLLFNGNIVLPTRNAKFICFLSAFNEKVLKKNLFSPIIPIYKTNFPTLSDYWLTGFCDAEGCFTSSFNNKTNKFTIRWVIVQKWEVNKFILEYIINLFTEVNKECIGYVHPHSVINVWELSVHGVKHCQYLLNYFDNFALKSKKKNSYNNWKKLMDHYKKKDHLDLMKQKGIIDLIKLLNKCN